jgi:hypothetical protein
MEQQVTDSIFAAAGGGDRDTVPQSEFQLGGIIPYTEKPGATLVVTMPASRQSELYRYLNRVPGQPVPEGILNSDFSFGMLTVSLVLLTVLYAFARRSITSSFLSLGLRRQHESTSLSSSVTVTWPPLARNLFTLLNVSLFAAIAAVHTGALSPMPEGEMIKTTVLCLAVFAGTLLFRHTTCIIVASVTAQKKMFMEYVSVVYSTWFIAAVCYFVLSSIILFVPLKTPVTVVYAGAVLTVLLLFLRTIRLLNIFIVRRVPILYFILYLCALEVLPVLIVLKILDVL